MTALGLSSGFTVSEGDLNPHFGAISPDRGNHAIRIQDRIFVFKYFAACPLASASCDIMPVEAKQLKRRNHPVNRSYQWRFAKDDGYCPGLHYQATSASLSQSPVVPSSGASSRAAAFGVSWTNGPRPGLRAAVASNFVITLPGGTKLACAEEGGTAAITVGNRLPSYCAATAV